MSNIVIYRTEDGSAYFRFSIVRSSNATYRAYILDMPKYASRSTSLLTTHRNQDGNRYYICWSKPIRDFGTLKHVISTWSDMTMEFIKTGKTIDQQVKDMEPQQKSWWSRFMESI